MIYGAKSEEIIKWVDVKTTLPRVGVRVLVWVADGILGPYVGADHIANASRKWKRPAGTWSFFHRAKITHWAASPKGPEALRSSSKEEA
jgi:hypothetical protein